jgi:hypothetical protein
VTSGVRTISRVAGFDAVWEFDLFGKRRRSVEAALDSAEAQIELRNTALITVIADVAREYFEIRRRQIQRAIASRNGAATQRTVDQLKTGQVGGEQSIASGSLDREQSTSDSSPGDGQPAFSAFPPRGQPAWRTRGPTRITAAASGTASSH